VESGQDNLSVEEENVAKKIMGKYSKERPNFKVIWVGLENSAFLRENFQEAKFLVYNPKSLKLTYTVEKSLEGISAFLDRVFGGAEKWIKLDGGLTLKV